MISCIFWPGRQLTYTHLLSDSQSSSPVHSMSADDSFVLVKTVTSLPCSPDVSVISFDDENEESPRCCSDLSANPSSDNLFPSEAPSQPPLLTATALVAQAREASRRARSISSAMFGDTAAPAKQGDEEIATNSCLQTWKDSRTSHLSRSELESLALSPLALQDSGRHNSGTRQRAAQELVDEARAAAQRALAMESEAVEKAQQVQPDMTVTYARTSINAIIRAGVAASVASKAANFASQSAADARDAAGGSVFELRSAARCAQSWADTAEAAHRRTAGIVELSKACLRQLELQQRSHDFGTRLSVLRPGAATTTTTLPPTATVAAPTITPTKARVPPGCAAPPQAEASSTALVCVSQRSPLRASDLRASDPATTPRSAPPPAAQRAPTPGWALHQDRARIMLV